MNSFRVVNSTVLIILDKHICFRYLLENLSCARLENNSKFKTVVVRRGKGKGTSRVYENGKVIVLGTTTIEAATEHVMGWLSESHIENKIVSRETKNIVACCSLPTCIKLEDYFERNRETSSLETELFPGLFLKVNEKVKATVFHNGKFYLRGSSDLSEIERCCQLLIAKLKQYPR